MINGQWSIVNRKSLSPLKIVNSKFVNRKSFSPLKIVNSKFVNRKSLSPLTSHLILDIHPHVRVNERAGIRVSIHHQRQPLPLCNRGNGSVQLSP